MTEQKKKNIFHKLKLDGYIYEIGQSYEKNVGLSVLKKLYKEDFFNIKPNSTSVMLGQHLNLDNLFKELEGNICYLNIQDLKDSAKRDELMKKAFENHSYFKSLENKYYKEKKEYSDNKNTIIESKSSSNSESDEVYKNIKEIKEKEKQFGQSEFDIIISGVEGGKIIKLLDDLKKKKLG